MKRILTGASYHSSKTPETKLVVFRRRRAWAPKWQREPRTAANADEIRLWGWQIIHVRFGSLADIFALPAYVRFTPESGHVQCPSQCLAKCSRYPTQLHTKNRSTIVAAPKNISCSVAPGRRFWTSCIAIGGRPIGNSIALSGL
jgi:hypothetical protein